MDFNKRIVRCARKGLSQEEALESLYVHPNFTEGTRVGGIRQSGGYWVATLLEPKAGGPPPFPPKDDEESDGPEEAFEDEPSGDSDEDSDSPEAPKKDEGGEEKGGEKGELGALLQLVHQIADALGIGPEPALPGAQDGPPPGLDAPLPPPGHPAPKPPTAKPKLRPGETPPGVTPINTPAFSSTGNDLVGRVASFTASSEDYSSIKEAKASLEAEYGPHGYKVKQIKRDGSKLHALLSVR